ncbi:MAG: peptidoglycan DD-metalloendopeptidase family protein [Thermoanaerobaculia bacterium]
MGARVGGVLRATRAYFAVVPLVVPLLMITLGDRPAPAEATPAWSEKPPIDFVAAETAAYPPLPEHTGYVSIERGDTLDVVFEACGFSREEANALVAAMRGSLDPRRIRPGQLVRYRRTAGGETTEVEVLVSGWGSIRARRDGAGFAVEEVEAPRTSVDAAIVGGIESSLWDAIVGAGEDPAIAAQLADIFQWDIDFFRLQQGDWFSVTVQKHFVGSEFAGYGPVLAARFHHRGATYEAFHFERGNGTAGYYTASGAPLRKQFLKSPLKFSRITSGFTHRRYHPVLKRFRPHYGVDYGAPTGTPVMVTADGVVAYAGRGDGEGNWIRVRHSAKTETAYLHLSRFAKGIRAGVKVRQGQVIGYVGETGLATAPHLDYRVRENGKWINPLKLRSVTPDPLRGSELDRFGDLVAAHAAKLPVVAGETLIASR